MAVWSCDRGCQGKEKSGRRWRWGNEGGASVVLGLGLDVAGYGWHRGVLRILGFFLHK